MNQPRWRVLLVLALLSVVAGCGSPRGHTASTASPPPSPSLALSVTTSSATWAAMVMGGSSAQFNNFWQLFVHPGTSARWQLVTPPGMASNGGFVLAGAAGRSLLTAFRPSQLVTYSPLTATADDGAHWATGQAAAGLADVPDALAVRAGSGLIALTRTGAVQLSRNGTVWTRLAMLRSLAATAAGRACGLTGLTAVAYSPAGTPLVAGTCARHAGIFAYAGGRWQAAGPPLPASLTSQPVTVLRLSTEAGREIALLAAGSKTAASVLAAWRPNGSSHWQLSPSLGVEARHIVSASFGPDGSVALVLSGGKGETLAGPGGGWRQLPALPPGTQALAQEGGGQTEALAAHRSIMTVWAHGPASAGWSTEQVVKVPIQYGSSG